MNIVDILFQQLNIINISQLYQIYGDDVIKDYINDVINGNINNNINDDFIKNDSEYNRIKQVYIFIIDMFMIANDIDIENIDYALQCIELISIDIE